MLLVYALKKSAEIKQLWKNPGLKKKKIGKVQNAVKSKISLVLIKNECMALHAHEMI